MENDNSVLGLATMRESRGISLKQISESTKLSVRFLQAIEAGDFQKLPGGIYNTSYIRQYAKAIDFDEAQLLAFYYARTGMVPSPEGRLVNANGKNAFGDFRPASTIAES